MKFAPTFPSWQSIAQTLAVICAFMGGIEMKHRGPRVGATLLIVAIILIGAAIFRRPRSAVKT